MTASLGGRYDPCPVKRSTDWLTSKWPYILSSFDEAAHTMGLNTSWSKTKIQNLGHAVTPAPVQLQGHVVESTDRFFHISWQ